MTLSWTVAETPNDRLDEVLKRASMLIARVGFERASIRALAAEVGMSQAGLYHYFRSKEELLYLIQKFTFTTLRNSIASRLDPNRSPKERLKTVIANHLDFIIAHMDEMQVCAFEYKKLSGPLFEEVREVREDYFRIAHGVVKDVLHEGGSGIDSKRATLYLFGALNWIHMWLDSSRKIDKSKLIDEVYGIFCNGLTNGSAQSAVCPPGKGETNNG